MPATSTEAGMSSDTTRGSIVCVGILSDMGSVVTTVEDIALFIEVELAV